MYKIRGKQNREVHIVLVVQWKKKKKKRQQKRNILIRVCRSIDRSLGDYHSFNITIMEERYVRLAGRARNQNFQQKQIF